MGGMTAEQRAKTPAVDFLNPIIADAEAATMIDSNIDPVDHAHIKGATVKGVETLAEAMRAKKDSDWETRAGCMTYPDAVAKAMKAKGQDASKWLQECRGKSLTEMQKVA